MVFLGVKYQHAAIHNMDNLPQIVTLFFAVDWPDSYNHLDMVADISRHNESSSETLEKKTDGNNSEDTFLE